jgi:phosphopantetheinyl transferase
MALVQISWCQARATDLSSSTEHLTDRERGRLSELQFEKRRADWVIGRLAAKTLACRLLHRRFDILVPPRTIEIGSDDGGAPVAVNAGLPESLPFAPGKRLPLALSISHSRGIAFAGGFWLVDHPAAPQSIGVDIETVERRRRDLFEDYFTAAERRFCDDGPEDSRDERCTLVWAAKEALLKATGIGLRIDTRAATCLPANGASSAEHMDPPDEWRPLRLYCHPPLDATVDDAAGWWLPRDGYVMTIVAIR